MTVNPKKLRPYDQPPRRRLTLIPSGPDSAATGFLVAAALWFAIAAALGVLAIGMRIVTVEFTFPLYLFGLEFTFDLPRVEQAFVNATVYGWISNAAFAAVVFMVPRLTGRRLWGEPLVNLGLAAWNGALLAGIAALYIWDSGVNAPLTAFPWIIDGGLATGAAAVTLAAVLTVGLDVRSAYVSSWFALAALLGLLGLTTLNVALGFAEWWFDLPDLLVALSSLFIDRGIVTLWLLGMTYATLHYVVPRASNMPLASGGLAILTWLAWLALAPVSGLGLLVDSSVPFIITTIGQVATIMLLLPALFAFANLATTIHPRWSALFAPGAGAFAATSLVFLGAAALLDAIGALRSVQTAFGFTSWASGLLLWMTMGAAGFAALALAEHALPRILRREWGGGLLSGATLWLAFGGLVIGGIGLLGGGMAEGSLLSQGLAPEATANALLPYRLAALAGMGLVALASLMHLADLFMMYTTAPRADYALPGQAAAAAGH